MSEREARIRTVVMGYFPMFIATLSLVTSIYNGYLNGKFVDLVQNNVARVEYMKTCKEVIDAYFQVKFRAGIMSANGMRERAAGATPTAASRDEIEGASAVSKFAALGTYLANLRDDVMREHYTNLSIELEKIMNKARQTPPGELDKLFGAADNMFTEMNDDCIKSAKNRPM